MSTVVHRLQFFRWHSIYFFHANDHESDHKLVIIASAFDEDNSRLGIWVKNRIIIYYSITLVVEVDWVILWCWDSKLTFLLFHYVAHTINLNKHLKIAPGIT